MRTLKGIDPLLKFAKLSLLRENQRKLFSFIQRSESFDLL